MLLASSHASCGRSVVHLLILTSATCSTGLRVSCPARQVALVVICFSAYQYQFVPFYVATWITHAARNIRYLYITITIVALLPVQVCASCLSTAPATAAWRDDFHLKDQISPALPFANFRLNLIGERCENLCE